MLAPDIFTTCADNVRGACGNKLFSVTGTHSTRPTKQTTLTSERPQAATAPWRGACSGNQVAGPKARVVQTRAQRVTAHCQQHAHCPRLLSATTSGTPGGPPGFNRTQWGPLHAVGACRPACHAAASARPTWPVGGGKTTGSSACVTASPPFMSCNQSM